MNKKIKTEAVDHLFEAILTLKTPEECYIFFEDVCTVNELLSLSQRYEVAKMLREKRTYLEIADKTGGAVLVKGGHLADCADDLLFDGTECHWFPSPRINNPNTHGTGCTLSSAIACNLAEGHSLTASVRRAKLYLTACIAYGLNLGHGSGPLQHKVDWE